MGASPSCLHCAVMAAINAWVDEHGSHVDKDGQRRATPDTVINALAQAVAEAIFYGGDGEPAREHLRGIAHAAVDGMTLAIRIAHGFAPDGAAPAKH